MLGLVITFSISHWQNTGKRCLGQLLCWRLFIVNVSLTKYTNQRTKTRPTACLVGQRLLAVGFTLHLFYIHQTLQLDIFWNVIRILRGEKNWWSKLGKRRKEAEWSTVDLFLKGDGTWSDWAHRSTCCRHGPSSWEEFIMLKWYKKQHHYWMSNRRLVDKSLGYYIM